MLSSTQTVTYNAVAYDLERVKEGGYASEYTAMCADGRLTMKVNHTIPPRGGNPEQHHLRLDLEQEVGGEYVRTASAWIVLKTSDGVQDDTILDNVYDALQTLLTATNVGKVINRES